MAKPTSAHAHKNNVANKKVSSITPSPSFFLKLFAHAVALAALLLMASSTIVAASGVNVTTAQQETNSTCDPSSSSSTGWSIPECVVAGEEAVAFHVFTSTATDEFTGEFSIQFSSDWGDNSEIFFETKDGFFAGGEYYTYSNHTYSVPGIYNTTFTMMPVQQNAGASLKCLGIISSIANSAVRVNQTTCEKTAPDGSSGGGSNGGTRRGRLATSALIASLSSLLILEDL